MAISIHNATTTSSSSCYAAFLYEADYTFVYLSVLLSVCPVLTVNSKTEKPTTFKLRREATYVRSNRKSTFEVKR